MKIPGPDHPITIEPNPKRVIVRFGGKTIADTKRALALREASYPAVQYIPLGDVNANVLSRTDTSTYCPFKGDCNYFSLPGDGQHATNAVWTYEAPFPAVAAIKGYLAFYPDRVAITETL